ncbi:hypothetical protein G9U51_01945 [Calidifontibacter sp. DB0510]|uniref:CobQ/CobB/MinD/ParA nucleotide binding domain-containing protein n=1 Tax=Metallococcus carri TaxID=1656884 RepID=A0A967EDA9_9MICO|nr:hypothetical protein [Metallococcus carri]NHN54541.1 hypothetical protein [Metallococcus carri]NOP36620.1 hypothetical protein [Calidifontibacter sp. DB2511S]
MSITVATGLAARIEGRMASALTSQPDLELVRRCGDLPELLAVAGAGRVQVALVSPALPGVDRSALGQLRDEGVSVVGVYADEHDERVLRQWGVERLVTADADVTAVAGAVRDAASGLPQPVAAAPVEVEPAAEAGEPTDDPGEEDAEPERGRVIVVWGSPGAPGRTTIAVNLSAELALREQDTLLIDADTYAASIAQFLAVLDEAPGIAAATRLAEAGRLDALSLAGVAPLVLPKLRVLTGLPRADRWPEIRPAAFEAVIDTARALASFVVIDIAHPIEDDEELSYDTTAPRRNAAGLTALAAADEVLVVGSGDPVGLQRLVRTLDEADAVVSGTPAVVVTKVRTSAAGMHPHQEVARALDRFAGVSDPLLIADDRSALDAALLAGRVLLEKSPGSAVCKGLATLADRYAPGAAPARRGRRRRGFPRSA